MKHILVLFLTMGVLKVYAQNSLSGKIIDEDTHTPLIGAVIYMPDLKKGTNSDLRGEYRFDNLPKGNFLAEIKYIGYSTKVVSITVNGETNNDFALSSSVTEIHEIVVTGVSASTEMKRNPVPTQIIGKDALTESVSTNIVEAISHQPGIAQISTGQSISKPIIRGLGYNRIISLYNGIRQEGQQWGDEHGMEIDEYSIDKVEIVKGPGSLMYGSDGIGGVVNFLSPDPQPDGKIIGNIFSNYQSNNNLIAYSAMNSGTIKGVSWLGRVSGKQTGDYENRYDGKIYNSGFKEFNYNGFVGLHKRWGYSQLHFASFNQNVALPEGDRDSLGIFVKPLTDSTEVAVTKNDLRGYGIDVPNQWIRHRRVYITNNFIIGSSKIMLNAGYQLNKRQEFGDPAAPDQFGLYFHLQTINYDIKYFLPEINGWKASIGINGMYQHNQNKGIEFLIPEYSLFDIGSYLFIQKHYDKLSISGGIRYDKRAIKTKDLYLNTNEEPVPSNEPFNFQKFKGFSQSYNNYSGSIGATYSLTKQLVIKGNIARGFRAPNIAELGSNGRHEGTFRYEIGDPNLQAETSFQSDLGISFNSRHITATVDLFNNQIQNYIYAKRLMAVNGGDSIADDEDPALSYQYGHSNARLSGGEIRIDIHPHPFDWLHFENSFSIVKGVIKGAPDSIKYLPFMPAPRYQSELKANLKKNIGQLSNSFIMIGLEYNFKQNQYLKENKTERSTPSYTLINFGVGTDFTDRHNKAMCTLILSANNIFDVGYQSHLSRLKYAPVNSFTGRTGIFNMGRNISVKLIIPITIM